MYKIIALDIDGTLVDSQKNLSPKTKQAVISAMKAGKKVVISTGRATKGFMRYVKELELERYGGYLMSFNGGQIIDAKNFDEPLFNQAFPNEYLEEICSVIKGRNVTINTYRGDDIIAANAINEYTYIEQKLTNMNLVYVEDFPSYISFPINKCLLTGDPADILELEQILGERFKGKLAVFKSETYFLEIVPLGIDKGNSLSKLNDILGIKREETIACGDGFNDITMIRYAGLGVAMQNACAEALAAADLVAPSNNDDGVAYIIENYLMK